MNLRKSFLGVCYFALGCGAIAIVACSSGGGGGFGGGDDGGGGSSGASSGGGSGGGSGSSSGGFGDDSGGVSDAPLGPDPSDPQPMMCEPDGAVEQLDAAVYGSIDCPSDKNREGCTCPKAGVMAPCWTGKRADRGVGQCKDGVTTCIMNGETTLTWGPCMGEVLPDPSAEAGAAACKCFSTGQWAIANVEPCIFFDGNNQATGAVSTYESGNTPTCPAMLMPNGDWSTDNIKVDCAGEFNLCYTIRAGDVKNPQPTDCVVGKACVQGWVPMANVVTPLPNLPGWLGGSASCAEQFATTGGYGEMSVYGFSDHCEKIGDMSMPYVFEREPYCPLMNPPPNCQSGGSGNF
jgi:hypothetical protein